MKVINLWAGPGAGKSTTASGLFYLLKTNDYNVELVTEYAKDMTWEGRHNILNDQIYVTAKQNRRLSRLLNHNMDLVITDSPLLLGVHYALPGYLSDTYEPLLMELWNQYENTNFLINRTKKYNPIGRNQNEDGARKIDQDLIEFLKTRNLSYETVDGDVNAPHKIFEKLKDLNLIT